MDYYIETHPSSPQCQVKEKLGMNVEGVEGTEQEGVATLGCVAKR